ncbi:MAG: hypothetical protein ACRDK2_10565 [Solirubrobacteraceae bacterium]
MGWGTLVERVSGAQIAGALLLPLGLAAALIVAAALAAFSATVSAATPVVAVGAGVGLVAAWPHRRRLGGWPLLAAVGVLLVYGAPVLLSGQDTFTGFIKLDDTATWFNVIDNLMAHSHAVLSGQEPSTYSLVYTGDVGSAYPIGAFVLPGVARALVDTDIAWVFQPYLAFCAAALALCAYALTEPLIASARLRALVAFLAAQSALLYGYSLWGGIKELTAAFLLALGVALVVPVFVRRPARARELLPLAIAAGALIVTLGIGAVGWVGPALAVLAVLWLWRARGKVRNLLTSALSLAWLAGLTALFVIPVWIVLGSVLGGDAGLFSTGQSTATKFGNLFKPLSGFQLAGIWPVGDFRVGAPTVPSVLLVGLVLIVAYETLRVSARKRQPGIALYVAVALGGCAVVYLAGGTPWVVGKSLAISSPALLLAALTGAVMLYARHRAGILVVIALAGGVLWSTVLAYHDVSLAPRAALGELQHIGTLLAGKGPTFINDYEVYADRHFLRAGAPVEPAEYRLPPLPLSNGISLTDSAWADIDSFPLSTLQPYRSLVLRRSPAESRPPSIYHLVYRGSYYELWQRPLISPTHIYEHISLGESSTLPYCGKAGNGSYQPLCSANPVAVAACSQVKALASKALSLNAHLLAFQRPAPIVARGDQTVWPAKWIHNDQSHSLIPTVPGKATSEIGVASAGTYELWLGGSFARGFEVSVNGVYIGTVENQLSSVDGYVHLIDLPMSGGRYQFAFTYPHSNLSPGSGLAEYTSLSSIILQPKSPAGELISVAPGQATRLCGRPLDWIEVVVSA